jgi:hypothetical protein
VSRAWVGRGLAALVVVLSHAGAARAEMVSGGDCRELSSDCTCDDAPYMSVFLENQEDALHAWEATQQEIFGGAASSFQDARNLFESKFPGDPRVLQPLAQCPNLDAGKIAGTSILGGGAELDDCFCKNVCRDIVDAIVVHERTHVAFNIMGISYIIGVGTACAADLTDPDFCKVSDALLLSESEIQAHRLGNDSLSKSLSELKDEAEMECTWEPLPEAGSSPKHRPQPAPQGFFPRLGALFARVFHGQGQ